MAVLVSPGVSVSVIDQSINVGAGPGTVPLIFIATQENKLIPDGSAIAVGTTKANAGVVWSITSQRDLVQTFGDPIFYSVSGTSLNGYPLNEYGLLAAYSYLGISNLCRVVRADVNTTQLEPTPIEPTSPAATGTYWLDESVSSNGLFVRSGTFPNEVWTSVTPSLEYNFTTGTTNTPTGTDGVVGSYAVVFQTENGTLSYWRKTGTTAWSQIGDNSYSSAAGATSNVYTSAAGALSNTYTSAAGATSVGAVVTVGSTAGLVAGMVVSCTAGVGTFVAGTTVLNVIGLTSFTASVAPSTPLSGGASVVSGYGDQVTVTDTTDLVAGALVSIFAGVGTFQAGTTVVSVDSPTAFTISAVPTVALSGGATVVKAPGTEVTVASTTGLVAGMLLSVTAGVGTLAANSVISSVGVGTFTLSAPPIVALSGGASVVSAGFGVTVQSVWPDLTSATLLDTFWIKTTSAAQGANLVLRKMSASTNSFIQVEAPILADDAAADTYYSANAAGSNGQIYVEPVATGVLPLSSTNSLEFRLCTADVWAPLVTIVGSSSVPTQGPDNGQLWFNALVGLNDNAESTVDILIADGVGAWQNINLPGFTYTVLPGQPTLYPQPADPQDNVPAPTLAAGDIWVNTDAVPYPVINRWDGSAWVLVVNTDETTPNGIVFQDARPNPLYHDGSYSGENNAGGINPDLDPDAPQAALYPKGFLLWNTRYSTNNVKVWEAPYVFDGVTAEPDDTNNGSTGRWSSTSGNNPGGVPYMGAAAQQIVIVKGIQSVIISNEDIRAEDLYFNLIAAPGFVEAIDEMLVLNDDRKDTAFVVGDTPFTLSSTGTSLQNWATNHSVAFGNGADGLVSASKYFGAWYPSGLSTNVDGTDVVVPPSHMALRTIAYNDQVAYPWFAPAGLQRGVVNNAAAVGYVNASGQFVTVKLNEGQRDILYQNGINPIRVMPQGGIVVFGQKTRQPYSSATDRINVVRLENYLRYMLNNLAQPFLFEPNDTTTRKSVKDAFDRALSELITLRGLYDFLVVCDLSNNTPARIDRNELWIDVAIQPVKAIEFIYIPIRIKNTGSSLTA